MIFIKKIFIVLILSILTAFVLSGAISATEKISPNKNGGNSNGENHLTSQSVSSDGRYVVFDSTATDLVDSDNNVFSDIFIRDTVTKKTQRINYKKDGTHPTDACIKPIISANGRYIAYTSTGNLGFGGPSNINQIYLYDRSLKTTELISQNSKYCPGTLDSYNPSISDDGRYVAFESLATNLFDSNYEAGAADTNTYRDIFLRDRTTSITKRINLGLEGRQALHGNSYNPSISYDGRYVAFESSADNLVEGDTNGFPDIFVRDIWTGNIKRIMGVSYSQPNEASYNPKISANGRYVVFSSAANNLVTNDHNPLQDVFLADMFTLTNPLVTLVSVSSSETQGDSFSVNPTMSSDGQFVAFRSAANNLISGDTNGFPDIFVRDIKNGLTKRLSVSSTSVQTNANSIDNSISGNGKYVVFDSFATNLVSGDTNNVDVFINTVDFAGPWIKSINPKNKAKKVKRSANIYIYFNENIRINSAAKIILKNSKGKIIASTKTISGSKLTINPLIKLTKYTKYYITILQGAVSDFANNYNTNTPKYIFKFTTGRR